MSPRANFIRLRQVPPNNSFNRSANSAAFIENLSISALCARSVNSGVGPQLTGGRDVNTARLLSHLDSSSSRLRFRRRILRCFLYQPSNGNVSMAAPNLHGGRYDGGVLVAEHHRQFRASACKFR